MHGLIVNQLRAYAVAKLGPAAWSEALAASGASLPDGPVSLNNLYDDTNVVAMVVALASLPQSSMGVLTDSLSV